MSSKSKNPYKRPDAFTKAAKAKGYPARSVFKLEEIDHRIRLLKPGFHVLDLGAAPGSWSLYVAQRVGTKGQLLAVDLNDLSIALPDNAQFSRGDALSLSNSDLALFAPYDVVLSDMAPSTTGSRIADQARSFDLFMRALDVAIHLSKQGASFVGKIFMSSDFEKARTALRAHYSDVRTIRPEGTRTSSFEVFLVGIGKKTSPQNAL